MHTHTLARCREIFQMVSLPLDEGNVTAMHATYVCVMKP